MSYSTIAEVLKTAGFGLTTTRITALEEGQLTDADVSVMIQQFIDDNDDMIDGKLGVPITIRKEEHEGDGENAAFLLGPEEEGHYAHFVVENNLVEVVNAYFDCYKDVYRRLRPYPTDCDSLTNGATALADWVLTVSNCAVTADTSIKNCGSESMQMVFSAAGYARYTLPNDVYIDQYEYLAFAFYASSITPTFTVGLYDESGNSSTQTFTVTRASQWYIIWIRIDNVSGGLDWHNKKLYQIEIKSSIACTVHVDMLNFNDGYCWAAPQGYVYIHKADNIGEDAPSEGWRFFVDYRYNPYLVTCQAALRKASSHFAAADLIEHLIALRQSHTAFQAETHSFTMIPDREALTTNEKRLREKGEEALASIGYGFDFDVIKG